MPRVLEIAMQTAIARRGVSVIAIPGDIALRMPSQPNPGCIFRRPNQKFVRLMMKSKSWRRF